MSKVFETGDLLCLGSGDGYLYPHGVGLALDNGKALIPSYLNGWIITDVDGLANCSRFGTGMNIRRTSLTEDGSINEIDYIAYDAGKPVDLYLRKKDDNWFIENEFEKPSWSK